MFKFVVKTLIVLVLAYGVGRLYVVFEGSMLTGERAPYIQQLSSDSVVIRWMSDDNEVGVLRYGTSADHMGNAEVEAQPGKDHRIKLTRLKAGQRYYYEVGTIQGADQFDPEKHWFVTHPEGVVPTRIWVMGDSGEPGKTLEQVRDAAFGWMKRNPLPLAQADTAVPESPMIDVWLALGDIAYRSGTNEQFQAALFDTFSTIVPNTSLWPVYGNHDARRWTYFRIFDLPEAAEAGGVASGTESYYSFDYSNVHFVMLDSQESDRSPDGQMLQWLQQDLAMNQKPWVIAALHHPPYTHGSHDSDDDSDSGGRMREVRENILPILEQAGVDLVLSGHSHMYERSYLIDCAYQDSTHFSAQNRVSDGVEGKHRQYIKPLKERAHQGTVYVVAGSASKVDQGPLDHPAHAVSLAETGTVVIDVVDDQLSARFINSKGEVHDQFSLTRKAGYDSTYQGCRKSATAAE